MIYIYIYIYIFGFILLVGKIPLLFWDRDTLNIFRFDFGVPLKKHVFLTGQGVLC